MNKQIYYVHELNHLLKEDGKSSFGYPGEILERCVLDNPEDAEDVLEAFLNVTEYTVRLQRLKDYKNAFNTDQLSRFIELVGNYRAELLRYKLIGETIALDESYITTPKGYIYLLQYVEGVMRTAEAWDEGESYINYLNDNVSMLYGYVGVALREFQWLDELQKDVKKFSCKLSKDFLTFAKLMKKACENVFKPEDVLKLHNLGYDDLSARELNARLIDSAVTGREEKATFEFLKEAFFGDIALSEETKEYILQEVRKGHIHRELPRAINGVRKMHLALKHEAFSKNATNVDFAFEVLEPQKPSISIMTRNLDIDDTAFKNASKAVKKSILFTWIDGSNKETAEIPKLLSEYKSVSDTDILEHISGCAFMEYYNEEIFKDEDLLRLNKDVQTFIFKEYFQNLRAKSVNVLNNLRSIVDVTTCIELQGYYNNGNEEKLNTFVEGNNDLTRAMYEIKEDLYYKHNPSAYQEFLRKAILTTGEIIHSKAEWLELLPEFDNLSTRELDELKKALYSEEDFNRMIKERKEAEALKEEEELIEKIDSTKDLTKLGWFSNFYRASNKVKKHFYDRIMETKTISSRLDAEIIELYQEDVINDSEFLAFFKLRKSLK